MSQCRIHIVVAIASFMLVSMLNEGIQAQRFFRGRRGNQMRIESRFNTAQENYLDTIGVPFDSTLPGDFTVGTYSTPLYFSQGPTVTIESRVQADFITQGNFDPLYDHGVSTFAGVNIPGGILTDVHFEVILRAVEKRHDAREININPTPGLNRMPDGDGRSVGGLVGFRFEVPFVDSVPNFENPEWTRFLRFESAVGVGQVQQKLRQQTYDPMYGSIMLGNIEPKTSAAYVDGEFTLGLGVLNNDWKFVANVTYLVRGTDLIFNEWGTTSGISVGVSAEISPQAVGQYLLRGRTRNFQSRPSF